MTRKELNARLDRQPTALSIAMRNDPKSNGQAYDLAAYRREFQITFRTAAEIRMGTRS